MVMNIFLCICRGKTYQNDQQTLDHELQIKNEIIAKLNDTDAMALAEALHKEPKFFDDFECKYFNLFIFQNGKICLFFFFNKFHIIHVIKKKTEIFEHFVQINRCWSFVEFLSHVNQCQVVFSS